MPHGLGVQRVGGVRSFVRRLEAVRAGGRADSSVRFHRPKNLYHLGRYGDCPMAAEKSIVHEVAFGHVAHFVRKAEIRFDGVGSTRKQDN